MKKFNFSYAIGEVLLIFIGITLAIAFQNWNEKRKTTHVEKAVLEQLKVALQNDLADVNANIATHKRGKDHCQKSLKALTASEAVNPGLFLQSATQAVDFTFLISDVSTYEYLKSVGLHIIRNDSLRKQITSLYDVKYESIYGIEDASNFLEGDIIRDLKKYFTANTQTFIPSEAFENIKEDEELRFNLKAIEFLHDNMINRYENKIKPELGLLIQLVNEELLKH